MQRFGWTLSLTFSAVLAAAIAAGCFAYLVRSPLQVEAAPRPTSYEPPNLLIENKVELVATQPKKDEERAIEAFNQAADTILKRAPNLRAEIANRPVAKVPLPRRRPTVNP
jgi:hypothetical protein